MPFLIQYILKLFIGLALVYIFYRLVLRKLTFYNWNRWYLLGYTMLAFLFPLIDITPVLQTNQLKGNEMIHLIPSVEAYTGTIERDGQYAVSKWSVGWDKWDWALLIVFTGAALLLFRLLIRYYSFYRLRQQSVLIENKQVKIYQVNKPIIPFSFGDSIFINRHLHTGEELQEIIRHEFVHVRQKHSHDIIWSELLCILNWYNPFAWMIRNAIRQNLEFIADNKVIEHGFDKKQYQYLLLKVVGNSHFSIANQFNFSSLKKRIAMMNQMKSARTHLLKFLFILPLLAVMLLAFRNEQKQLPPPPVQVPPPDVYTDTVPPSLNEKGYYIDIIGVKEHCTVVVKDKKGKEVERVLLTQWDKKESYYQNLYGMIPPPPPPAPPVVVPGHKLPKNVSNIRVNNNKAIVTLKDGTKENYDLDNENEKALFEKRYGTPLPPPPPPAVPGQAVSLSNVEVTVAGRAMPPAVSTVAVSGETVSPLTAVTVVGKPLTSVQAMPPMAIASNTMPEETVVVGKPRGEIVFELKIYKTTTREKLNQFIELAKEKEVALAFDKMNFNDNNELISLSGTMEKGESKNSFCVTDFEILTLMIVKYEGRYSTRVYTNDPKEMI